MPVIGTAGHVDHGKSTLIHRLTGRDPDRWEEEKRRGLTIDLGFAWARLPNGQEVSFVDVPGHERYLKNMLAGIEAIDVALFVVAADEGWMPQSEEHLAVLDLLEIRRGVVALTKTDIVDTDLLELATLEVSERLAGTSLENAHLVPVSGATGSGLAELVDRLEEEVGRSKPTDRDRPRLWVDRSFTATGAGTVVTGTLLDGSLAVDDQIVMYPDDRAIRVRGIQSHEQSLDRVDTGRRVALNLSGVEHTRIKRGDMAGRPGEWELTTRVSASVRPARYVDGLDHRGAYQLHLGTAVLRVEIVAMEAGAAILQLQHPLPIAVGDRFIIRDTGRRLVVAGGRVLDPAPGRTRTALAETLRIDPEADPDQQAGTLLELRGADSLTRLWRQTRGGRPKGHLAGDTVVSDRVFDNLVADAVEMVASEHRAHPLRVGLPIATLTEQLGVAPEIAELVIEETAELIKSGPDVSHRDHEIAMPDEAMTAWERAREALAGDLAVPTISELGLDVELLHLQLRSGELVKISQDLVMLPDQIEAITRTIEEMPQGFTVAQFRDATGLSRKYAVPLLEWSDREGITLRRGDTRTRR